MSYRMHVGDCLEVLPELIGRGVRVSLANADIPYFKVKGDEWDRQWKTEGEFLAWVNTLCGLLTQVLLPNGSLYLYASPQMARKVGNVVAEHFQILTDIRWRKPPFSTKAEMTTKEDLRSYFPASETILFAEQTQADYLANGRVFAPLKSWFRGRAKLHGIAPKPFNVALGFAVTGSGMAGTIIGDKDEFQMPSALNYERMRHAYPSAFDREYDDLRAEYENLKTQYEASRRPFTISEHVPYTDVWDFPTVLDYPGKHPCEKPYPMMEHIVRASSREGDAVLDLCAGSGVFGEAALANGRDVIAIERSQHWANKATHRAGRIERGTTDMTFTGHTYRDAPLFGTSEA